MSSLKYFQEYQRKKAIKDAEEEALAKANTRLFIAVYNHFGCSGPVTVHQKKLYLEHLSSKKEKQMNDTANTTNTPIDLEALQAAGLIGDITITEGSDDSDEVVVHTIPAVVDQPVDTVH